MRVNEIKFQFLYSDLYYSGTNKKILWFKKVYSLDQLIEKPLHKLSDAHAFAKLVAKRQYTGLKDKNGVEVYEGDILAYGENVPERVVIFENGAFRLEDDTNQANQIMHVDTVRRLLIVGNMYQNPEFQN